MRTIYDIRRENLRVLMTQWGGPTSLAKKLGHANGSYLAQLAGPNPSRDISERVARDVESKLGLPPMWFDQPQADSAKKLNDEALATCVRAVATVLRDKGLRPDPETYATLVQLAYDHQKLVGGIDEGFITKLTGLIRK
jgi:hypothetical protein